MGKVNESTSTEGGKDQVDMGYRLLAFLGYWSPIFSLVVLSIAKRKSRFALYHSIQGGILGIFIFLLNLFLNIVTGLGTIVGTSGVILTIILFSLLVTHLVVMTSTLFEKKYELFLLGDISDKLTNRWYSPQNEGKEK